MLLSTLMLVKMYGLDKVGVTQDLLEVIKSSKLENYYILYTGNNFSCQSGLLGQHLVRLLILWCDNAVCSYT